MAQMESHSLTGLRRIFNKPDMDVDKFISKVSKNGGSDILQTISDLNKMTEEASAQIKKAIFNNFGLFIDAGKAVSGLGTTMHQLDHLLVEQKRLCSALMEKSLFRDEKPLNDASRYASVTSDVPSLLNSIEGVSNLVKDSSRQLLFDVDAIEVDSVTYRKQGYVHLFVLTDYVLVAKRLWDSYEGRRYRKQALYEIENVAAINVKAAGASRVPQNLIQLMVFPDVRAFQLDSLNCKRALISAIDEAKRLHVAGVSDGAMLEASGSDAVSPDMRASFGKDQDTLSSTVFPCSPEVETACFEALVGTIPEISKVLRSYPNDSAAASATNGQNRNPFNRDATSSYGIALSKNDAWLSEVPEDVDVAVAIRDFAEATRLICRARCRLEDLLSRRGIAATAPDGQQQVSAALVGLTKLNSRVEQRASNLAIVLEEELTRASERHISMACVDGIGVTQSVRAAVLHLSELGKTVIALHLFLAYRSGVIGNTLTRGVRQEGNQLVYLNRLSLVFHRGLVESVAEWNQIIQNLKSHRGFRGLEECVASKLCSWILDETARFCNQLKVVLIDSRSVSYFAMACASQRIHAHSKRVTELIGIDVKSTLDNCLLQSWQRVVEEQGRVYRDAVSHRASTEIGQSLLTGVSDANLKLFIKTDFPEAQNYPNGGRCLTVFTTQNSRSLSHFAKACAQFDCVELKESFATTFANMLRGDYEVYAKILAAKNSSDNNNIIIMNINFFVSTVIPKLSKEMDCQDHLAVKAVLKDFKKLLRENPS